MKKVYLVLSDTNFGGAGRVNLLFVEFCDKMRFDITVLLPKNSALKEKFVRLGVKIIETEYGADRSFELKAVFELYRIFKKGRPDIVHTHASMAARVAARLAGGCKIIATRHSVFPVPKHYPKMLSGLINDLTADRYIAVSQSAKENLILLGASAEKIDVVLNGTKPINELDKGVAKKQLGVENRFVISIIGRLEKVKGHEYFLQAARLLEGTNALFVIAGTGALENELRKKAGPNVLFTGHLNNVETLINATDIIANCSYGTEATSMAIIEGMSVGKPCIATDYGGNPYVVKDGVSGYIVPQCNAKVFAEKCLSLMDSQALYSKMALSAKKRYKTLFTAEKMTENTQNVYEKVLFRNK